MFQRSLHPGATGLDGATCRLASWPLGGVKALSADLIGPTTRYLRAERVAVRCARWQELGLLDAHECHVGVAVGKPARGKPACLRWQQGTGALRCC